jgi:hypothetical protein
MAPPFFEPAFEEIDVVENQTASVKVPTASFTVTITASSFCSARLPEVARTRTYRAKVSRESFPNFGFPQAGEFLLRLEGDTFRTVDRFLGNAFVGAITGGGTMRFEFTDPYNWDFFPYFLHDDLSDPDWHGYLPRGSGTANPSGSALVGTWKGTIGAVRRRGGELAYCDATDHRFTMVAGG